jgi:hypothetical protein
MPPNCSTQAFQSISSPHHRLTFPSLPLSLPLSFSLPSQGQSGHKGLPTSPSITAALGKTPSEGDSEEESTWGYKDWSVSRHSWMRDNAFGHRDLSPSSGGLLLRDFSSFLGESPMFEASGLDGSSLPRYSAMELVTATLSLFMLCTFASILFVYHLSFPSLPLIFLPAYSSFPRIPCTGPGSFGPWASAEPRRNTS